MIAKKAHQKADWFTDEYKNMPHQAADSAGSGQAGQGATGKAGGYAMLAYFSKTVRIRYV